MAAKASMEIHCVSLMLLTLASRCYGSGLIEGLYCGKVNCYDVLGLTRDADKQDIGTSYRRLAEKYHPDATNAEEKIQEVANAYKILNDDESRQDYDYMLDHPEEFYGHYYRYYRRRMAPRVDFCVVIAGVIITFVSVVQYWYRLWVFNDLVAFLLNFPKYRNMAISKANELGLLSNIDQHSKSKDEIQAEVKAVLMKMLKENVTFPRGDYDKPSLWDVLWVRIVLLPYTLAVYTVWWVKWHWRYSMLKEEYRDVDRQYLTMKALGLTVVQWERVGESQKSELIEKQLWIKENFQIYAKQEQEEMKAKHAKYQIQTIQMVHEEPQARPTC